jgi:hypothetical protein
MPPNSPPLSSPQRMLYPWAAATRSWKKNYFTSHSVHGFSGVTGSILSAGLILIVFVGARFGVGVAVGVAVAVFAVVVTDLDPRDSGVAAERDASDRGLAGSCHA